MKKKYLLRFIPLMALLLLLLCPLQVHAANYIYIRKGVTGSINFKSSPVPNARWKVGNSSILKLKSSTSKSASYTGKKVGKTTLTVYNSKKTSQKYVWTVYVMPSKKLLKMDFEVYGSRPRNLFGVKEGENIINSMTGEYSYCILARGAGVTRSTSASFFQTTRTLKFYDSYSRFCTLYGNLSLKTYISSKDRYWKYVTARKSSSYQSAVKSFFNQNVYYYTDCKYNNTYMMRFLFDRSKELSGVIYFKNYDKLPIS